MARRALGPNDLPDFARPEAPDHRRADQKREEEGGHRGSGGAKADVVEKVEDDVGPAERGEPVIEHRTSTGMERSTGGGSVLRASFERRKYTLQRHSAGCLEYDHFVSPKVLRKQRRQAQWISCGDQPMPERTR